MIKGISCLIESSVKSREKGIYTWDSIKLMWTDGVVFKMHGVCSVPRPEHVVLGSSPGVVRDFFIFKIFGQDNQNT